MIFQILFKFYPDFILILRPFHGIKIWIKGHGWAFRLPAVQNLDQLEGDWLNQVLQQNYIHFFILQLRQLWILDHIGLVLMIYNTMMEFFATNQHCQVGCEVSNLEAQITRLARFCQKKKLFMEVFVFCELPLYQIL